MLISGVTGVTDLGYRSGLIREHTIYITLHCIILLLLFSNLAVSDRHPLETIPVTLKWLGNINRSATNQCI